MIVYLIFLKALIKLVNIKSFDKNFIKKNFLVTLINHKKAKFLEPIGVPQQQQQLGSEQQIEILILKDKIERLEKELQSGKSRDKQEQEHELSDEQEAISNSNSYKTCKKFKFYF